MKKSALAAVIATVTLSQGCQDEQRSRDTGSPPAGSSRLSELLSPEDVRGYARALEPRSFSFPADHGQHPRYRNEWWYVTGNLDGADGERFGFELTIFRFSLAPVEGQKGAPRSSAWATNQVYIGHFAVTDVEAEDFYVAERYARGALGLAGARAEPLRVWLENWYLQDEDATATGAAGADWRLYAKDRGVELSLALHPLKPAVPNGRDGLSQKSAEPGNASYYYSVPRLEAEGKLRIAGDMHDVSGLAWLDREWGSSALSSDQEGWDWFALQLSDGSDLMFYQLRRTDGRPDPHSAGTWILADGSSLHLSHDDVLLQVRDHWDSPRGGRYPMAWSLAIPRLALELHVDPVLKAQELATEVRYWEGAVDVTGQRAGKAVDGRGYVELTGYARGE